jgi:glycosyltransferase involved in cell wall biosynthesis
MVADMTPQITPTPLVSVVMPVYRAGIKLERSLRSILDQTFTNFEFIIICDEPSATELCILNKFQRVDSRLVVIVNPNRSGLVASLNTGISIAKGKYIARMDADDVSYPTRIETQVSYMEAHPNVGICGTAHILKSNEIIQVCSYPLNTDDIAMRLMFGTAFGHPTVMFRSDFIKTISGPYDSPFIHAEDYELWVRCVGETNMANLPDILMYIENDGNNVSSIYKQIQLEQTETIRDVAATKLGFPLQGNMPLEEWLMTLSAINRLRGRFDEVKFNKNLGEDWYNHCLMHTRDGFAAWEMFWNSNLSIYARLSLKRKMKFFIACLIKWQGN